MTYFKFWYERLLPRNQTAFSNKINDPTKLSLQFIID